MNCIFYRSSANDLEWPYRWPAIFLPSAATVCLIHLWQNSLVDWAVVLK